MVRVGAGDEISDKTFLFVYSFGPYEHALSPFHHLW